MIYFMSDGSDESSALYKSKMEIFRNVLIPRYTTALRLHHHYHFRFVTRLERIEIRLYYFLVYALRLAMEGADGSGVQENQHLMENGTTAVEPVTLLTVKTSLELEAGEVKENRSGGEMKNGLSEPMSVSARAGDPYYYSRSHMLQ